MARNVDPVTTTPAPASSPEVSLGKFPSGYPRFVFAADAARSFRRPAACSGLVHRSERRDAHRPKESPFSSSSRSWEPGDTSCANFFLPLRARELSNRRPLHLPAQPGVPPKPQANGVTQPGAAGSVGAAVSATPGREALASPSAASSAPPNRETLATPSDEGSAAPNRMAVATPSPVAVATPDREALCTPSPLAVATPNREAMATPSPVAVATPDREALATPSPVAVATPESRGDGHSQPGRRCHA